MRCACTALAIVRCLQMFASVLGYSLLGLFVRCFVYGSLATASRLVDSLFRGAATIGLFNFASAMPALVGSIRLSSGTRRPCAISLQLVRHLAIYARVTRALVCFACPMPRGRSGFRRTRLQLNPS